MRKVAHGAETKIEALNGVADVLRTISEILYRDCLCQYVSPYYPDTTSRSDVWTLPSVPIDWIPKWIAETDEGYRIAVPYATPWWGNKISLDLQQKLATLEELIGIHVHGTHQVAEYLAHAATALGRGYGVTFHTHDWMYLDLRVKNKSMRERAKEAHTFRTIRIAKNARWRTVPSLWFGSQLHEATGFGGELILLKNLVLKPELMTPTDAIGYETMFRNNELPSHLRSRSLIGCLGRVSPEKNLEFLVQYLYELKQVFQDKRTPDFPLLVICGPGPEKYRTELRRKFDELGLQDDVVILDGKQHDEMIRLMQIIPVLVFPSETESYGIMMQEGEHCGAVPLVMRHSAHDENMPIEELALVKQPICWAKISHDLLTNEKRRRDYTAELQNYARSENNPQAYRARLLDLYRELG
ncbi:MAG: glycosyltransferase [Patescibacteria group bacterium]